MEPTILSHTTTIDHLLESCWDLTAVESYCQSCKNFDVHFSCPQHQFHIPDYLKRFNHALVVAHAIPVDQAQPGTLAEKFYRHKQRLDRVLLNYESNIAGSISLIAGQCQNCQPACEESHLPACPNPDLIRYSFESLGFNVSAILQLYFDKKLSFKDDTVQLVYGYLLNQPLSDIQWHQLKGLLCGNEANH